MQNILLKDSHQNWINLFRTYREYLLPIILTLRMLMAQFDVSVTLSSSSTVLPSSFCQVQADTSSCRFLSAVCRVSRDPTWFKSREHTCLGGWRAWLDLICSMYCLKCQEDKYFQKTNIKTLFITLIIYNSNHFVTIYCDN